MAVTRSILAMFGSVLVAACTTTTVIDSTTLEHGPSASPTSTTSSLRLTTLIEGLLPNGQAYLLESVFDPSDPEEVFAVIEVNLEEAPITGDGIGCPTCSQPVLGITTFRPGAGQIPAYDNGVYEASSGDWTMRIEVYENIVEAWGDEIEADLLAHIRPVESESGLPSFQLSGPFQWTEDTDVPGYMEVLYAPPAFVVRRGCDELSVSCSSSGAVQVIPIDDAVTPMWEANRSIVISDGS